MTQATPGLRAQAVSAFRQIADLIESHPKLPVPTAGSLAAHLTTSEYPPAIRGRFRSRSRSPGRGVNAAICPRRSCASRAAAGSFAVGRCGSDPLVACLRLSSQGSG